MARRNSPRTDPVIADLEKIRSLRWTDAVGMARELTYLLDNPEIARAARYPADRLKRVGALGRLLDRMLAAIGTRERRSPPPYSRSIAFAGEVLLRRTKASFQGHPLADAPVSRLWEALENQWLVTQGENRGNPLQPDTFRVHHRAKTYELLAFELRSLVESMALVAGQRTMSLDSQRPEPSDHHRPELWSNVAVYLSTSPSAYKEHILPAEDSASRIDRIPKRVSVMFKDPQTVLEIAQKRFGHGSRMIDHYVEEHRVRSENFISALVAGIVCREIYNVAELRRYAALRTHSPSVLLEADSMHRTIARWRNAILSYPTYVVALTDDPLPFKYEVIDGRLTVLHEVVGVSDVSRLNGIFLDGREVAETFQHDFEVIWERVPPDRREPAQVVEWIDAILVPEMECPKEAS